MAFLSKATSRLCLAFGIVALCMQGAMSHTYFSNIYVNDKAETECMRAHPATAFDSPIPLVSSADMTCGWRPEADKPASKKCPVAAGTKVGLQWWHSSPGDDVVDPTHAGPLMVYMAKSESGSGNVWFKIYEDGYTKSTNQWAVDKLIANRGRVDVTIPADIEPGNYLLRGEILALHGAYDLNGVQPYVGCVELTISGSGKAKPAGVAIPGVYSNTDPGMLFSRYQAFTQYIIPGPAVYKSGSTPSAPSTGSSTPATQAPPASTPAATQAPPASNPATSAPVTQAPATQAPPASSPTTRPVSGETIKVALNGGANTWWVAAQVSGGGETTVKVEMMDSGSLNNWVAMSDMSYAYVYSPLSEVVAPISLRVTSSSGKQVVLTNVFASFASKNLIDSGKTYSPSSPATSAPTPAATVKPTPTSAATPAATVKPTPTSAATPAATVKPTPTSAATASPVTGNAKITLHEGASEWWFALTLDADVSKVEIKDSGAYTSFSPMVGNSWGGPTVYTFATSGASLVAPITARITSKSGKVATATITSFAPNAVFAISGSL